MHRSIQELCGTNLSDHLCRRLRRLRTNLRQHAAIGVSSSARLEREESRQRRRGSWRPTPCRRLSGTSISAQSASQMSRGGAPSSSASSAVLFPSGPSTRSFTNDVARAWNSVSTARRNSLRRIVALYQPELSAAKARARSTPRGRRGRHPGRPEYPQAPRCDRRPHA